jgi:hypothetical protein
MFLPFRPYNAILVLESYRAGDGKYGERSHELKKSDLQRRGKAQHQLKIVFLINWHNQKIREAGYYRQHSPWKNSCSRINQKLLYTHIIPVVLLKLQTKAINLA